jgi:Ca2+-binding RTX toxin-like protein
VSVSGKTQFETVVNGGEGYDVVTLTDKSDAYFLHDNHSAFNTDIILSEDFRGRDGFNRISLIEEIASGDGNDVIDLTSPDYSLAGQTLLVNAGDGQDVVWGSDADETLIGGADNDVMFGGAGINELFGGSGADEFQFTRTSENDTVSDFSIADGDTLKFFNKGGALFDRDSLSLNAAGDELSIAYGDEIGEILTITLYEAGLNLDDLTADVLIIV